MFFILSPSFFMLSKETPVLAYTIQHKNVGQVGNLPYAQAIF